MAPPGLASVFDGPHVTVRIVGVEAAPYEFPPQGVVLPPLVMTPAFYQKYANGLVREGFLHVRLAAGADLGAFAARMSRQLGVSAFATQTKTTADVQRSIHLEASVLWVGAARRLVGHGDDRERCPVRRTPSVRRSPRCRRWA